MAEKTHLERTLETLVDLVDLARKQSNEKFDKLAASLDVLALNVGQLATQQKATASNIDRMAERLDNSINRLITAYALIDRIPKNLTLITALLRCP